MLSTTVKRQVSTSSSNEADAISAFENATCVDAPFKHWLFKDALPLAACHAIIALPIRPATITDTMGKRDSHNDVRRFFAPDMQAQFAVMHEVAHLFQSEPVVRSIERLCGIHLTGSFLRIEYCQDREGFWLEPHMDIREKHITMQIYLNNGPDAATLGTDMYDHQKKYHSTAPSILNEGMIFIPAEPHSWHGFEKRPIADVRRSLIINYVTPDWRAVHELAFPTRPIAY